MLCQLVYVREILKDNLSSHIPYYFHQSTYADMNLKTCSLKSRKTTQMSICESHDTHFSFLIRFYISVIFRYNNLAFLRNSPICTLDNTADDCTDPGAAPTNGQKSGDDYSHGQTVTYTCDTGYTLSGDGTLTCELGVWDNAVPTCLRKRTSYRQFIISCTLLLSSEYKCGYESKRMFFKVQENHTNVNLLIL